MRGGSPAATSVEAGRTASAPPAREARQEPERHHDDRPINNPAPHLAQRVETEIEHSLDHPPHAADEPGRRDPQKTHERADEQRQEHELDFYNDTATTE